MPEINCGNQYDDPRDNTCKNTKTKVHKCTLLANHADRGSFMHWCQNCNFSWS